MDRLEIVSADITTLAVDVIVNATNSALSGGGGVDGAVHRAAGPELMRASRAVGPCPTGDVRITPGFGLPAKWVIHAVGPVWQGGTRQESRLLASCYRRSLEVARDHGARTIAFPSVSTGIYGYPVEQAAPLAVAEIQSFLSEHALPEKVTIACFDDRTYRAFNKAAAQAA
jgi:O-acetyl-ADP-ribose deacetylase